MRVGIYIRNAMIVSFIEQAFQMKEFQRMAICLLRNGQKKEVNEKRVLSKFLTGSINLCHPKEKMLKLGVHILRVV